MLVSCQFNINISLHKPKYMFINEVKSPKMVNSVVNKIQQLHKIQPAELNKMINALM